MGWRWALWENLSLRAALGFVGTVAAQSRVEATFSPRFPAFVDGLEAEAEEFLNTTFTSAVFSPTFTLALGYRIF